MWTFSSTCSSFRCLVSSSSLSGCRAYPLFGIFHLSRPFPLSTQNKLWNGWPDDWSGGFPGDGKVYSQTTLISEVNITPFNEPGDVMYPSITDLPDGCATPYFQKYSDVCHPSWVAFQVNPKET